MQPLHKIGIVGNYANALAKKRALHTTKLLEKAGVEYVVDRGFSLGKKAQDIDEFQVDLLLVFGGDGTMLYAARHTRTKVPLLGVNCGEKGFLMHWNFQDFDKDLTDILKGKFGVEERARLQVVSPRGVPPALNEYLLVPKRPGHYVEYDLKVDGKLIWNDASDGLMVVTPTGSTGHAMSAAGAHITPEAKVVEIVSMGSMDRSRRPLVFPDHHKIEVLNFHELWGCELVVDGQRRVVVENDLVIVKGKPVVFARKLVEKKAMVAAPAGELSPSARFVLKLLEFKGPLSQKELAGETGLPSRTVRRAAESLVQAGKVVQHMHPGDARKTVYALA